MRTERELYQEALDVQDACNLSGVVHSFDRAVSELWGIAFAKGEGTHWVNTHPVCRLYIDKLRSLAELDDSTLSEAYGRAHVVVGNEIT